MFWTIVKSLVVWRPRENGREPAKRTIFVARTFVHTGNGVLSLESCRWETDGTLAIVSAYFWLPMTWNELQTKIPRSIYWAFALDCVDSCQPAV